MPYNKNLFDAKEYFKKVLGSLSVSQSWNLFQLLLDLIKNFVFEFQIKSDDYNVKFGTKIYLDQDVKVNQRFDAIAEHNYLADIESLDFNNGRASADKINNWVKEATGGKIKDLVSEEAVTNSIVLLINALYFEGTWRFGFNKTLAADFNVAPGQKLKKQFMERTGNFYYFYSKQLDAKLLRLPYNGRRYSMFIVLPNESSNLDKVIEGLSSDTVKNEVWHMDDVEVHVVLPKFKFDSSVNLNEVVKQVSWFKWFQSKTHFNFLLFKLGIKEIFETTATFPLLARGGSSEGKLKVSNIIQKSGIIVDEVGELSLSI